VKKTVGVLRFPGTNCDRDVFKALEEMGFKTQWLWHQDHFEWQKFSALVLPGGFSFGDYLRAGALAARSQVIDSLKTAAEHGVPVLGICNGFQILCETHLLPGALVKNESLRFRDDWVEMEMQNPNKYFAATLSKGQTVRLPIAHGEGRFYATESELNKLFDQGQVWLTYKKNPNGALRDIAGIANAKGNVVGLMPHPERAVQDWMGGIDGQVFFKTLEALV
jgi:phosphoribosylformylglycinamidine synthase